MKTVRAKISRESLSSEVNGEFVGKILETVKEDGACPGINRVDTSGTAFAHGIHLDYTVQPALACKKQSSVYAGNRQEKQAIQVPNLE
jgi:hypothetical protein